MDRTRDLICVVDDDASVCRALRRMAASLGFDTQLMLSGRECLDTSHLGRAACLIVDVNMPGIDGFQLHALLQESGRDIPTIMISGYRQAEYRNKALAVGAVAFLSKPLDEILLCDAIDEAISRAHDSDII